MGKLITGSFEVFGGLFSCSFGPVRSTLKVSYFARVDGCGTVIGGSLVCGRGIDRGMETLDGGLRTTGSRRRFFSIMANFCGTCKINVFKLGGTFEVRRRLSKNFSFVPVGGVSTIVLSSLVNCRVRGGGLASGARTFMRNGGTGGILLFKSDKAKGSADVGTVIGRCCSSKLHVVRVCGRRFGCLSGVVTTVGGEGCEFVVCVSSLSFRRRRVRCGFLGTIVRNNIRAGPSGVLVCTASGHHRLVGRA